MGLDMNLVAKLTLLSTMSTALVVGCLSCEGRKEINFDKLAGVWHIDANSPRRTIFVYETDHTYELRMNSLPGAVKGKWILDGDLLITTLEGFRDTKVGETSYGETVGITNRILKLTEAELILQPYGQRARSKFVRVE
jgi:hypothetical protein